MHEYLTSENDASESNEWDMKFDAPDKVEVEGDLEQVSEEIGAKESTMDDAEILSDSAVKEADQVEMDKLALMNDANDNERVWFSWLVFCVFFFFSGVCRVVSAWRLDQKHVQERVSRRSDLCCKR